MAIKYSPLGFLIYVAMFIYLSAFIASALGPKKFSKTFFTFGFLIASAAFAFRWLTAGHIPFQNMFEIFLSMAVLIYPISIFCEKKIAAAGQTIDMLLGAVLLFPAGFIFNAGPQMLPPALQSPFFIPHIAVYLIAYLIMTKAAAAAFKSLSLTTIDYEISTYKLISFGFPLLTLGLVFGSYWAKIAWGNYWNWDPKEMWSLATWLIYLLYFHFRFIFGRKYDKINASLAIAGFSVIIITLLWVNLSRIFHGLHNYAS